MSSSALTPRRWTMQVWLGSSGGKKLEARRWRRGQTAQRWRGCGRHPRWFCRSRCAVPTALAISGTSGGSNLNLGGLIFLFLPLSFSSYFLPSPLYPWLKITMPLGTHYPHPNPYLYCLGRVEITHLNVDTGRALLDNSRFTHTHLSVSYLVFNLLIPSSPSLSLALHPSSP